MQEFEISVEATIAVTERSRSTWWRRITRREVTRVADDASGRTMLLWSEVAPMVCISMSSRDLTYLLRADSGDASAQSDIGQLFSTAGRHTVALYWIRKAADQEYPDAMQWLGRCYLSGDGVPKNDNLGVMWIAKAAAHGHSIALEQMDWLTFKSRI